MKIALASDLHLEFQDINLQNTENADVLILSGDIMVAEYMHDHAPVVTSPYASYKELGRNQALAQRFRDFLSRVSFQFPHVVYVAGNHELYHGRWVESLDHLREECGRYPNIHFLEQETVTIGDCLFMGATLWTDCHRADPVTLHNVGSMLNDFRVIRNDTRNWGKLRPEDTVERHRRTLEWIAKTVAANPDTVKVMVGHHGPSSLSTHPRYQTVRDHHLNGGYISDLSGFIHDNAGIALWTHGHTHDPFDYTIGTTRVVCNPRGYAGADEQADHFALKFLEI